MIPYIIFNLKEEVEDFSRKVDFELGYPKEIFTMAANGTKKDEKTFCYTYATPIKKYNDEKYAYPISEVIKHLIPVEKELSYDLGNWYPDAIIWLKTAG